MIELDVHWIQGALRIAHCGGLHIPDVDSVLELVNVMNFAAGFEVPAIRFDTETIGCSPSFSSLPPEE